MNPGKNYVWNPVDVAHSLKQAKEIAKSYGPYVKIKKTSGVYQYTIFIKEAYSGEWSGDFGMLLMHKKGRKKK